MVGGEYQENNVGLENLYIRNDWDYVNNRYAPATFVTVI